MEASWPVRALWSTRVHDVLEGGSEGRSSRVIRSEGLRLAWERRVVSSGRRARSRAGMLVTGIVRVFVRRASGCEDLM